MSHINSPTFLFSLMKVMDIHVYCIYTYSHNLWTHCKLKELLFICFICCLTCFNFTRSSKFLPTFESYLIIKNIKWKTTHYLCIVVDRIMFQINCAVYLSQIYAILRILQPVEANPRPFRRIFFFAVNGRKL